MKKTLKLLLIFMFSLAILLPHINMANATDMENDKLYITTLVMYDKPEFNGGEPVDVNIPVKYEIKKDGVLYSYEDEAPYVYISGPGRVLKCLVDKSRLASTGGSIYDGDSVPDKPYVNGIATDNGKYPAHAYAFLINGSIVEYKSNNTEKEVIYLFHANSKAKIPDYLSCFGNIIDDTNYIFDGWYTVDKSKDVKIVIAEEENKYISDELKSYTAKWILDSSFTFNDTLTLGEDIPSLNVPNALNSNTVASWYDLDDLNTIYSDALTPDKSFELDKKYVLHIETKLSSPSYSFDNLMGVNIGDVSLQKQIVEKLDSDDDEGFTEVDCKKLVKDKKINGWYVDEINNTLVVNYIFPATCNVIKGMSGNEYDKPLSRDIEVEYVTMGEKIQTQQLYCNYLAEDIDSGKLLKFERWKTISDENIMHMKTTIDFDATKPITKDIIIFPEWDFLSATRQPTKDVPVFELDVNNNWLQKQYITYSWEMSTNYVDKEYTVEAFDEAKGVLLGEFMAIAGDKDDKFQVGYSEAMTPEDIKDGVVAKGEPGNYMQYVVVYSTDNDISRVTQLEMTFKDDIVESNFEFGIYEDDADYSIDGKKLIYNIRPSDILYESYLVPVLFSNVSFTITDIKIFEGFGTFKEIPGEISNILSNVEESVYRCKATLAGHNIYSSIIDNRGSNYKPDPEPTSGGSKKYKANDTKDTAEKISGSGKKGSTRTITPIEGKKVASVVVTDKDGNKVDVALNEDGTYSFIQPASNVDVQVNYKNREIVLNIGSTNASVDGEKSNLDVAPILRNDRTMLPIRFVAENLGAKVEWNELEPNMVYITRGDIKIEIKLGSNIAKVNGKEYELDSVAFAENDRTYLPVRFVSEALNAIVEWNESKPNEVKIYEQ